MRDVLLRVRAKKARPRKSCRPAAARLEDRVLLSFGAAGDVLTYHNDNSSTGSMSPRAGHGSVRHSSRPAQ